MTEVGGQAPSVAEFDELLWESKFSAGQPRPESVSRDALIERARGSGCRVVAVTAPAGYGKSTLLNEWAAVEDRRVAWVSLDRYDDDPAALLALLASAYSRVAAGNGALVREMQGLGVSVLGRAAPRLAAAFRTSPVPFVLMLDDLHVLQSADCHDVLGLVIAAVPPGSQLVTASRTDPPHLARLRVSHDVVELTTRDLALDAAGAELIFATAHIPVTAEQAADVTQRTEGWPVGLFLAALIARDHDGDVSSVAGDDRYVTDYLYRESLMRLPEATQRFLRRSAVLDQLGAPLCDVVVGEPGAHEQLRRLEAANLFLIPLDRRREWFRYHALFREFLIGELRREEPDLVTTLHLRAADWYEANGSPAVALEHLFHAAEQDRCVQLASTLILATYQRGQLSTVQRWLAALGNPVLEAYPPIGVLAGWCAALTGQVTEAQRWAAILDGATYELPPVDGTASFRSSRAMLRSTMCAAGPERAMTDADVAVAEEPPWSPWRPEALLLSAEAHLLVGERERAVVLFEESTVAAAGVATTDILVLGQAELAVLAMDRGEWDQAAEFVGAACGKIDAFQMHDYATCVMAFAAAARLAVHRGDVPEAERRATQAMRARVALTFVLPYLAVRARLHLAKAYWALGNHTGARHLLREIDEILRQRPDLGTLVGEVDELRRTLMSSAHQAGGGSPLSPAELRLLPYLQTHLTFREIGERLFVSRNTVNSQVGSIYRKLGVSSRNDAVQHATTVGLLGA